MNGAWTRTAAGVLLLATGAFLLVAIDPWTADRGGQEGCAMGPWSSSWVGSPRAFTASRASNHSAYSTWIEEVPENETLPAERSPEGWNRSRLVLATWKPPVETSGGFGEGTITMRAQQQDHGAVVHLRFEATGTNQTLRDLVAAFGENVTALSDEEVRSRVADLTTGSGRTEDGSFSTTLRLGEAPIDVTDLLATIGGGERWGNRGGSGLEELWAPGPPGASEGPRLSGIHARFGADGWTVQVHPSLAAIKAQDDPVTVVLASTGNGWIEIDSHERPTDARANELLEDLHEDLDLGPAPDRSSWSWSPAAIC